LNGAAPRDYRRDVRPPPSLGLLTLALVLAACGGGGGGSGAKPAFAQGSFVGQARGSDAFVAVVAGKENVAAYVCDGARGIAELFSGPRSGGSVRLTADDGSKLAAVVAIGGAHGNVTLPHGGTLTFFARPAYGKAGFYRATGRLHGEPATLGWVVLYDGRQRGALKTTTVTTAPMLNTATQTATLAGVGTINAAQITPSRE
jgi:hypothetical protein